MRPQFSDYPIHVQSLVQAALAAADPAAATQRVLQQNGRSLIIDNQLYPLAEDSRLCLVSVGKAAIPMAQAALAVVGTLVDAGIVLAKRQSDPPATNPLAAWPQVALHFGSHPVSDHSSIQSTQALLALLADTTPADRVLLLLSGGTSALLTDPLLQLADWQALTEALLVSGCPIQVLNTVRRQLDRVKGGGLAQAAAPAQLICLILSDVVGNDLRAIGSGPAWPHKPGVALVQRLLAQYEVAQRLETAVWQRIEAAIAASDSQTAAVPAPPHIIVGDVRQAAQAVLAQAARLGFLAQLLTAQLAGEAREVGHVAAALAKDLPPNRCLILGGETTVTVRGDGLGGRNLELALAAALDIVGEANMVIFTLATDGEDGPTDAAGAVVTGATAVNVPAATAALANNDSYTFFRTLDAAADTIHLLRPGPTGTNVNDLLVILRYAGETAVSNPNTGN